MLNHITLMGRLVAEPELKRTTSNVSMASIRIACDRDYAPEGKEKVCDFINATAWRQRAEFLCRNFHKGDPILVDGRLEMRSWKDKDGNNRITYEVNIDNIYFCGAKRSSSNGVPVECTPAELTELDDDESELPWNEDDELPL